MLSCTLLFLFLNNFRLRCSKISRGFPCILHTASPNDNILNILGTTIKSGNWQWYSMIKRIWILPGLDAIIFLGCGKELYEVLSQM